MWIATPRTSLARPEPICRPVKRAAAGVGGAAAGVGAPKKDCGPQVVRASRPNPISLLGRPNTSKQPVHPVVSFDNSGICRCKAQKTASWLAVIRARCSLFKVRSYLNLNQIYIVYCALIGHCPF